MAENGRVVALLLSLCVTAIICLGGLLATSARESTSIRGSARRLLSFGNPEDEAREYRQGMIYGAQAPPQNPRPYGNLPPGVSYGQTPGGSFLDNLHPSFSSCCIPLLQAIFACAYYFLVVKNYPYIVSPTKEAVQIQAKFAPTATCSTSWSNCFLSMCCPQARAAHTFSRTQTFDYWFSCVAMLFCPCCTVCYANTCTDLNTKLGGEPTSKIWNALTTWCCMCCIIAQDAEALDLATGYDTGVCGVTPAGAGKPGVDQTMPMATGAPTGPMATGPLSTGMSGSSYMDRTNPTMTGPMGSGMPMMGGNPAMASGMMSPGGYPYQQPRW